MFSVAIETMIDEMRSLVMKTALIRPHSDARPRRPARTRRTSPGHRRMPSVSATYWATEAVAVNEMSMPPATSTTSSPEARMPTKALEVSRSNRFCRVRKLSVASDSASESARMTDQQPEFVAARSAQRRRAQPGSRHRPAACRPRLHSPMAACGTHSPTRRPAAHHQDAMRVIEDLRNLVRDQQDGDALGRRARAPSRRCRPWRRCRRPPSGCRGSGAWACVAIHLASTTRCWLPPESVLTALSGFGALIARSSIHFCAVRWRRRLGHQAQPVGRACRAW